jgi:acyl-CoA thioesterase-1
MKFPLLLWGHLRAAPRRGSPLPASSLLAALGLALLLACTARAQTVLVLGDSISAGYGMALEQSWVSLLEQQLRAEGLADAVVNASISGETTAGGLRRLPALLRQHQPDLLLVELGGNDGLRGYPVQRLRANLEQMVTLGQAAGASVLLLPMEIPPNYGRRYTDSFRASFADAAAASDAALGPFPLDGVATEPELMQSDGIHPTAQAQPLIAEQVLPSVRSLLQELSARSSTR